MPAAAPTTHAAPSRILAVDVLRGLTIVFMVLVNDAGDGPRSYAQLQHAEWNGLTLTDLVFPTFLFLVGASIIFSLSNRIARGDSRAALARNIIRRAISILLIDWFIALFPYFRFGELRIFGVLTRIALCYLVVGLLCLFTRRAAVLASLAVACLLGYWILMRFVPVPGYGIPTHTVPLNDPDGNLVASLDRTITAWTQHVFHTGRLYERTRDPEGLLSTLPALATTLIGALTGLWLRRSTPTVHSGAIAPTDAVGTPEPLTPSAATQTPGRTLAGLAIASVVLLALGFGWNHTFPINKKLWTSSYVLAAAGFSMLGLTLCYFAIDYLRLERRSAAGRRLLWPWLVFGSNAITAYAVSELLSEALSSIRVHEPGLAHPSNLSRWIYVHLFAYGNSTANTSLAFAISYVIVCFLPNLLLWRKRIFLKV